MVFYKLVLIYSPENLKNSKIRLGAGNFLINEFLQFIILPRSPCFWSPFFRSAIFHGPYSSVFHSSGNKIETPTDISSNSDQKMGIKVKHFFQGRAGNKEGLFWNLILTNLRKMV